MRILAFIACFLIFPIWGVQSQELEKGVKLSVMPLVLDVKPPQFSDNVMIRNYSRMPVRLQVRVFRWQQKGGKDYYAPTNDVVVTPPFVSMKSGGLSTVRVTRVSKSPVVKQESYRVFVDQIPPSPLRANRSGESSAGVSMVLRQVIPVFFSPSVGGGAAQGTVSFVAQPAAGGFNVVATNRSANRIKIVDVFLLAGGQVIGNKPKLAGYALPGSDFRFFVPTRGGGKPDRIRFTSDSGPIDFPLQ